MSHTKELLQESERLGHGHRDRRVCGQCLNDGALAEFVSDHAAHSECDFCKAKRDTPFAASLGDVIEHMAECINDEYTNPVEELPYETAEGGWQGEVFDAWELLVEVGFECESENLFHEIGEALSNQEWCRIDYFSLEPSQRLSFGWERFKDAVKHARRFTFWSMGEEKSEFDPEYMPVGGMLATIGGCIQDTELVKVMPAGKELWRVRVHDASERLSEDHQLSPPPVHKARQSNRMSPAGVVMFYGAEDFETASLETIDLSRDRGKHVTGCKFQTLKDLTILDLVDLPTMPSFFQRGTSEQRHTLLFLREFARDLSSRVARDGGEHIEYVPTQAFTEYVRFELNLGDASPVDGIRYRSAINGQPCYVLFCTQAECVANTDRHSKKEQWLRFDPSSLKTRDVEGE